MAQKLSGTILISESLGIENTNNFNTKYFNIKQEKMTPIEWLALRYHQRQGYLSQDDIAEAKAIEKEQMYQVWKTSEDWSDGKLLDSKKSFEEYYNETFNK